MVKEFFKNITIIQVIAILSLVFLASAYFIQYFLEIAPCKLCLYQRIPYVVLVLAGILSFIRVWDVSYSKVLLNCARLLILLEICLSFYQVGIERDIFYEIIPCEVVPLEKAVTKDMLRDQIKNNVSVSCREVGIRILGLSLAEINFVLSICLMLFTYIVPYDIINNKFINANKKK